MKKILKILIITIILKITILYAYADNLNYKEVMVNAVNNSFDLKMSAVDIDISNAQLKAVRADWYPTLSMQFNTEHNSDLANGRGNYAYAGNTMITPYTQYRNMLYLTLSYNIFDFGIQGKKVDIAKKELEQKKISYEIQLKDLKLKVLDLYTKTQQYTKEINTKTEIFSIYENMFHNKERMYKAGIDNKLSVMDEAVKMARAQNDIENSKLSLKNTLEDLSVFTQNKYDYENLTVNDINVQNTEYEDYIIPFDYENILQTSIEKEDIRPYFNSQNSLEATYYDLEIEKKKSELSILKRQLLPTFRFYTGYSLYGQNPNNYWGSVQDVGQRSLIIGISSNFVFFDGFKNKANREKTSLEIQKLVYEKEKKLAELQNQYEKSYQSYDTYTNELIIKQNLLNAVEEKLLALERLHANKLAEQNELLSAKADLLNQKFELEQNIINITSKLEEMNIISGANL
jgi:hypothetical protein